MIPGENPLCRAHLLSCFVAYAVCSVDLPRGNDLPTSFSVTASPFYLIRVFLTA